MLLAIFILLLAINIIGFFNRKRAWSKMFMISQVFVVGGLVIMFNVYNGQTGIDGLEAKKKLDRQTQIDKLKNEAKTNEQADTLDMEKDNQGSQKVNGF